LSLTQRLGKITVFGRALNKRLLRASARDFSLILSMAMWVRYLFLIPMLDPNVVAFYEKTCYLLLEKRKELPALVVFFYMV